MESYLEKSIKTIIDQFPGFISWKNTDLSFAYMNQNLVELIGYKEIEQVVSLTDFDLKCKASEYAEVFRQQDKKVFSEKLPIKTLDIMEYYDKQCKVLICNKFILYDKEVCIGLMA